MIKQIFAITFVLSTIVCRQIVLNELNADDPKKLETMEFIELKMISDRGENDFSLKDFYVTVIEYNKGKSY